jgi:hypothetical protein
MTFLQFLNSLAKAASKAPFAPVAMAGTILDAAIPDSVGKKKKKKAKTPSPGVVTPAG